MAATDRGPVANLKIRFQSAVFSLGAIKLAAYRLLGRATVAIEVGGDEISCLLEFPSPISQEKADQILRDFRDEVLDQDLRERIAEETSAMRNAILAHAFSRTGLQR